MSRSFLRRRWAAALLSIAVAAGGLLLVARARFHRSARPDRRDTRAGTALRFTIPEGWNLWRADAALASTGFAEPGALLDLSVDPGDALLADLPSASRLPPGRFPNRLEGYLFPDTYLLPYHRTARALALKGIRRMKQVLAELMAPTPGLGRPLSTHAILTLASIVEREAVQPDEMPKIAAVYLNRLGRGMKLQADPTFRYGPLWWRLPPSADMRRDGSNPYNTYAHPGLPPGPIAAPGRQAIAAVLRPARTRALFFVAVGDGSGRHAFARTYAEHRRNVRKLRRRQRR